ncbi:MAG: DNA-processing protein DprA [Alphaproteobacteria bacterium]|jgi:DNA processing protein|nr:DNA-processing protein DprA [Candidatus Jidaibacter sp.]
MFLKNLNLAHNQFYQLKLFRSENIGAITYNHLIKTYGSAEDALDNVEKLSLNGGLRRKICVAQDSDIMQEIEKTQSAGGHFVFKSSDFYPSSLMGFEDSPPVFTAFGNLDVFKKQFVGIVGSRNASINGCKIAERFASTLADSKIATVSGLAIGVDTWAHKGSLSYGTVAVLAGGADVVYPQKNLELYNKIQENGAVISEKPLGVVPIAQYFPQRNRIISGMCTALIVIEASLKSGSLITAAFALKQNRKVYAVPASPLDDRARGCNELIKKNQAVLLNDISQVIDFVNAARINLSDTSQSKYGSNIIMQEPTDAELSKYRRDVHRAISFEETDIETIITHCKVPVHILNVLMLELELAGKARRLYPNKITRIEE